MCAPSWRAPHGPEHVAKFTTYLSAAVFVEPFYQVREKVFADWYPGGGFPPNTLLVVARLVQPDFMVEIEAVAARAPGAWSASARPQARAWIHFR